MAAHRVLRHCNSNLLHSLHHGQVVPGTGTKLSNVGDDFEDENWKWIPNGAKASREQDNHGSPAHQVYSQNRRWFESPKRGMPDVIERVETPAGGIPGSKGALKLQTLNTGIPGRPSFQMEQDDFIMSCSSRIGGFERDAESRVVLFEYGCHRLRTGRIDPGLTSVTASI